MILDFDASARETSGLWLVFPQQNNKKYFVPEEKISAILETDEDVMIYLVSKTSGVEQFRIENARLDKIIPLLKEDQYIDLLNQDNERMLIHPRGINAVRLDENPVFEVRVASQDCVWGEGHGSLSYVTDTVTPEIQTYLDSLPKPNKHGWSRPLPA